MPKLLLRYHCSTHVVWLCYGNFTLTATVPTYVVVCVDMCYLVLPWLQELYWQGEAAGRKSVLPYLKPLHPSDGTKLSDSLGHR